MGLDRSDVEKIAHLARVQLDEQDIPQLTRNLSDILGFVEQLNQVDTSQVAAMAHPLDAAQRLREDVVSEADQRAVFQQIAPQTEAGLYLVPKVIE